MANFATGLYRFLQDLVPGSAENDEAVNEQDEETLEMHRRDLLMQSLNDLAEEPTGENPPCVNDEQESKMRKGIMSIIHYPSGIHAQHELFYDPSNHNASVDEAVEMFFVAHEHDLDVSLIRKEIDGHVYIANLHSSCDGFERRWSGDFVTSGAIFHFKLTQEGEYASIYSDQKECDRLLERHGLKDLTITPVTNSVDKEATPSNTPQSKAKPKRKRPKPSERDVDSSIDQDNSSSSLHNNNRTSYVSPQVSEDSSRSPKKQKKTDTTTSTGSDGRRSKRVRRTVKRFHY